jgi:adenosylmethionine-8-amino-7-oxononanoate aminotransferase
MITFAKGVSSGYIPLGGLVCSSRIAAPYYDEPGNMLRHGATYAGHPAACAAANAVLDIYENEDLIARGQELEQPLADALAPLADHPAGTEVRAGLGFLAAVAVDSDAAGVGRLVTAAREKGVLVRALLGGVAMSPPLISEPEHLELLVEGLTAGVAAL